MFKVVILDIRYLFSGPAIKGLVFNHLFYSVNNSLSSFLHTGNSDPYCPLSIPHFIAYRAFKAHLRISTEKWLLFVSLYIKLLKNITKIKVFQK